MTAPPIIYTFTDDGDVMHPLRRALSSVLAGFTEHSADTACSETERSVFRNAGGVILSRATKPIIGSKLHSVQQLNCCCFFDTTQRMCQIDVGSPQEAESQACRGFIRDRCSISHSVFLTKHAPQTAESIYRDSRIVNPASDKSPCLDPKSLPFNDFNIGQSSDRYTAKLLFCVDCGLQPLSASAESAGLHSRTGDRQMDPVAIRTNPSASASVRPRHPGALDRRPSFDPMDHPTHAELRAQLCRQPSKTSSSNDRAKIDRVP